MSVNPQALHGEVARLLDSCQGRGAVVAARPAGDAANHHHFYAGVARAPVISFLEALLLALGGDLADGCRRYQEIVVAGAGRSWSEGDLDRSSEEVFRLPGARGPVEWGATWGVRWYRSPPPAPSPAAAAAAAPGAPGDAERPDPRGGLRGERRRGQYSGIVQEAAGGSAAFPVQIDAEEGTDFPKRYDALRKLVEMLEQRSHPTLLLIELGMLDYASPDQASEEHARITGVGIERMAWFQGWIDGRSGEHRRLDAVLYSRNRGVVDAFLGAGLPRRPSRLGRGAWQGVAYQGGNLTVIDYPCGPFPWGERLFTGDRGFARRDGSARDLPDRRAAYPQRTLKALLRGESASGEVARLRFAELRPTPPPRPERSTLIDREFWLHVETSLLRQALQRQYFGAAGNQAVGELLETLEFMQRQARSFRDPLSFHQAVRDRWIKASAIFLWGEGGTGKSYLGKLLAPLLYGQPNPVLFSCQEAGGGHQGDPVSGFRNRFFGPAPGFLGSDRLTEAGGLIIASGGFTVIIFDEVNKIAPGNFVESMEVLFALLEDRRYLPGNPGLVHDEAVNLWNTVFVMTANLDSFPPEGVPRQNREAIRRRVSPHEFRLLDEEGVATFAQWYLPQAVEERLGGAVVCTCGDLRAQIARLALAGRAPDSLRKELARYADTARENLESAGIAAGTAPLILDVTEALRQVLQ
jgi:hypothetical protein